MPPDGPPVPLVGRRDELAVLERALAGAAEGRGSGWLVTGEAGVGKSRLVAALAAAAGQRNALVLVGRCHAGGDLVPYGAFLPALHDARVAAVDAQMRARLDELSDLFVGRHSLHAQEAVTGQFGRARVLELALDVLTALSTDRPVLLVVEDLHWVDQSSLHLLSFLVHAIAARPVLVVATLRDDESVAEHGRRRAVAELVRSGGLRSLALHPLSDAAMLDLIDAAAGDHVDPAVRARIAGRADGNPFFALELLAAALDPRGGDVPATVRDSVLDRLAAVSPPARELVRLASTVDRRVPHELLERGFRGDPDQLETAVREVVEAGLLRVTTGAEYAFAHALVRDAVYGDLLPGERRRCHEAVAQALAAARPGPGAESAVTQEAYHWRAAGRWPEALRATVRAGDAAVRSSAYPEAAEQYERALAVWPEVDDPAGWAGCDLAELVVRAADACRWTARTDRALALVEAHRPAVATADAARLLERAGRYRWELGDTSGALAAYDHACSLLDGQETSALRASALAARATGLILLSRFGEAFSTCERALAEARAAAAPSVEAHVLATAGVAMAMTGRLDEGIDALRQARAVAERTGDVEVLCRAHSNLSWVLEQAGRIAEALAVSEEGMRATAERGLLHSAGVPLVNNAASQLVLLGRWDDAERLARDLLERPGMTRFAAFLHLLCAETATARGDVAGAEEELHRAESAAGAGEEPQFAGPLAAVRAELALWRGRPDVAARLVTDALEALGDSEHREVVLRLTALGGRALADLAHDRAVEPAGAPPLDRLHALVTSQVDARRAAPADLAQVGAWEATAAAELGRRDGGGDADAWETAVRCWDALGLPYHRAYAQYRLAEVLSHRRALTAATAPLTAAVATARSLGATPLAEAGEALRRRAGLRLGDPPAPVGPQQERDPFGLTAREKDVLLALVDGRTNRQIARQLFITEKTTEIHVSRILAKLGVRNRLEAAAVAHRRRLVDPP